VRQQIRIPAANRQPVLERVMRYLALLPADKEFTLKVEPYRKSRSQQQNRYLWGVCYATIMKEGGEALEGWDANDLHEYFLGEHFGWETISGFGRMRMKPLRRSSKLTTVEFAEFVDFIQRKAAELGVYIPDPEEEFV
jgi:hypothetical protein